MTPTTQTQTEGESTPKTNGTLATYDHRYAGYNSTRGAHRCTCGKHGARWWVIDHVADHAAER